MTLKAVKRFKRQIRKVGKKAECHSVSHNAKPSGGKLISSVKMQNEKLEADAGEGETPGEVNVAATPESRWRLLLPHVSLVALLICYIIFGALLFHAIEAQPEIRLRNALSEEMETYKMSMLNTLYLELEKPTVTKEQFQELADTQLIEYERLFFNGFDHGFLLTTKEDDLAWTFLNAIMFAVTMLTTIGYGNTAPSTPIGRVLCVAYGMIGIPLTLVVVADLAKFLGTVVTRLYKKATKFYKRKRAKPKGLAALMRQNNDVAEESADGDDPEFDDEENVPMLLVFTLLLLYPIVSSVLVAKWEKWNYFDAFYFCFISVFTIGFGDFFPTNNSFYFLTIVFILIGLIITTMCVDLVACVAIERVHYFGRALGKARQQAKAALKGLGTSAAGAWKSIHALRLPFSNVYGINGLMPFGMDIANPKAVRRLNRPQAFAPTFMDISFADDAGTHKAKSMAIDGDGSDSDATISSL